MMMEKSKRIAALQLVEFFVIVFAWAVQGSTGSVPLTTEGGVLSLRLQSPTVSPPLTLETTPPTTEGPLPTLPSHFPVVSPLYNNTASPPSTVPVQTPPLPPSTPESLASPKKSPVSVPVALAPVAPSSVDIPQNAPTIFPSIPGTSPPISQQRSTAHHNAPLPEPITTVASPPTGAGKIPEAVNPTRTRIAPSISPVQGVPSTNESHKSSPAISPVVPGYPPPPVQGRPPSSGFPENSPAISPVLPGESEPSIPVPGAPLPSQFPENSPAISPVVPGESPPITPVQGVPPTTGLPQNSPASSPVVPGETSPAIPDGAVSPASTPPTSTERKRNRIPAAAPNETPEQIPPVNHSPPKGSFSAVPPSIHNATGHSTIAPSPSMPLPISSPTHGYRSPASSPSTHNDRNPRDNFTSPAPASYLASPPSKQRDHVIPPAVAPTSRPTRYAPPPILLAVTPAGRPSRYAPPPFPPAVPRKGRPRLYAPPPFPPAIPPTGRPSHYAPPPFLPALPPESTPGQHAPPPLIPGSSVTRSRFPFPPSMSQVSPSPSPGLKPVSASTTMSLNPHPPELSPSGSKSKSPLMPPPPPIMALPPPPPNEDCSGTICTEPLTNSPPGSPCACVWPMQVGLSLDVDLYTFFPLVTELATEIAAGVFMKQSQVRIMGANAASQQPEKTVVLIDLVPLGQKFDHTTAYLTFQRFWLKEVDIKKSYFGDYEVLYVRYQGLPPSPPLPPSSIGLIDDGQYSGNDKNGRTIKPLGVDVGMKKHKNGLSGSIIAIIVLSALVVLVMCSAAAWVLLLKRRNHASQQPSTPQASLPSLAKQSGAVGSMIGSVPSSDSLSFESGIATYTGSAKTYSITDIEKATNNFDESRILGEGGFGLVYSAVLDDGTKAAVKVLKRDDQQGGREFFAEVEMLSRLHHRNLVKLIGICTEERARCLVYELIPNGSVESHLHGVDKESAPLDWAARMKIALGAARGLAYLHEDSSPRVIHRDFKSSNILLENDFTPKVSDFGLARTALDEEGKHISTRVMGTFGYVAPEYAMTGHLLVKSDVYSYGVVLLELLTGRKPVDMSQPPGQENLVAWARPLLTSQQGLEILIDSSLGPVHSDTIAKVAAIASMCVQPEVSHRPFMGEVVQALKLVCSECDKAKETGGSRSSRSSHEELSVDSGGSDSGGESPDPLSRYQYSTPTYNSSFFDPEMGASGSGSFRRHSTSGPLKPTTGRGWQFLQRTKGASSGGSVSEHRAMFRSHPGSY